MVTRAQIEAVLEARVRPMLRGHGGDVRLVGMEGTAVGVELLGACSGCPSADLSTRSFIEETLQMELPELRQVELTQSVSPELLDFARSILECDHASE